MIKFGDRVKVTSGFYEGMKGTAIESRHSDLIIIEFDFISDSFKICWRQPGRVEFSIKDLEKIGE